MKKSCSGVKKPQMAQCAFSLVEMLMALLVASLLLAALAPVMTKKMDENVFVSGTGRNTSEHYAVFDDVSKNGTEDNTFTIPSNAVNVRVTMIGGGGAGGGTGPAAAGGRAGSLYHRRMGVLWP